MMSCGRLTELSKVNLVTQWMGDRLCVLAGTCLALAQLFNKPHVKQQLDRFPWSRLNEALIAGDTEARMLRYNCRVPFNIELLDYHPGQTAHFLTYSSP